MHQNNEINKEIILQETIGVERVKEFVRTGIPFAKGELSNTDSLVIRAPDTTTQPVQTSVLGRWHDGSVKWLLVDFFCSIPPRTKASYFLANHTGKNPTLATSIHVSENETNWSVDTGPCRFLINKKIFSPFSAIQRSGTNIFPAGTPSSCILIDEQGKELIPYIERIFLDDTSGPLRTILHLYGFFGQQGRDAMRFSCSLHFFGGSSLVQIELCLHNPRAARHPGGLWDLGDLSSFLLKEFSLQIPILSELADTISCQPSQESDSLFRCAANERLSIYQESSGGEHWQSPVHRNRNGEVPLTFRGYEIYSKEGKIGSGLRATPVIWCGQEGGSGVAAVLPCFWQEFPKRASWENGAIKISLFPEEFPDLHELQGGEQKTHTVVVDFSVTPEKLNWARMPLSIIASPNVFQQAEVLTDLPLPSSSEEPQPDLIDLLIDGPEEFYRKREALDEYGWRNFGDVYADHEAVFHQGPEIFVSHYNNQYDLCSGFYRKFIATSNPLWGQLAMGLARHVLDIDIYHTTQDREEYNHGLFWHTDHYVDAGLSSHRSFSKEHLTKKNPHFCGGGPGAEHCYSTGLMIHYFLTGTLEFKKNIIDLAEWVVLSLKGPQTILAAMKRGVGYLKLWHSHRGAQKLFPRYPFTRGTGNAISACLDAYTVSGDKKYLSACDELLQEAIHPNDNIQARGLLDTETAWSYTILLTAIGKVINKKKELEEQTPALIYATKSLLAYAEWMALHEYPYLDKPEILEYPNETWAAQDLRKAVVLLHAAHYASTEIRPLFLSKARFFWVHSRDELLRQETSRFTRPLALACQNSWAGYHLWNGHCFRDSHADLEELACCCLVEKPTTPSLSFPAVLMRIAKELIYVSKTTNIARELAWLRARK